MYDPAPGTGQIWLDDVQCTGNEERIINCPSNNIGSHNCAHFEDVGINCLAGMFRLQHNILCVFVPREQKM